MFLPSLAGHNKDIPIGENKRFILPSTCIRLDIRGRQPALGHWAHKHGIFCVHCAAAACCDGGSSMAIGSSRGARRRRTSLPFWPSLPLRSALPRRASLPQAPPHPRPALPQRASLPLRAPLHLTAPSVACAGQLPPRRIARLAPPVEGDDPLHLAGWPCRPPGCSGERLCLTSLSGRAQGVGCLRLPSALSLGAT